MEYQIHKANILNTDTKHFEIMEVVKYEDYQTLEKENAKLKEDNSERQLRIEQLADDLQQLRKRSTLF